MRLSGLRAKIFPCCASLFLFCGLAAASDVPPAISPDALPRIFYRDVPGVTGEEIRGIEALRAAGGSFSYAMLLTSETFLDSVGRVDGYSRLFCEWLTGLFGIPFRPEIREWDDLVAGLNSLEIDFSGELVATEERSKLYYMAGPIAERTIKCARLADSPPFSALSRARTLRFAFLRGTITVDQVTQAFPGKLEVFQVGGFTEAHALLLSGAVDAFFSEDTGAPFDEYSEIITQDYFPLYYNPVSLSTRNTELAPIISVVQKALDNGALGHLGSLYREGQQAYRRHKLFLHLTDEEKIWLAERAAAGQPVPLGIYSDDYPRSFYNEREDEWQGIAVDVLRDSSLLTGLDFVRVHDTKADWADMQELLRTGRILMVTDLAPIQQRTGMFLQADRPYAMDTYAMISSVGLADLDVSDVLNATVGLTGETASAEVFHAWFPRHKRNVEYANPEEAFEALQRGEVDLVMGSINLLLNLTHYREIS